MRDFREHLKQRRPVKTDVVRALRRGQLGRAVRIAKAAGTVVSQPEIDETAKRLFDAGRSGELLALVGSMEVSLPFDAETLLVRTFEARDYHTFLKQVHRLGVAEQHRNRIQASIEALQRRAPSEASAWRRKLGVRETP